MMSGSFEASAMAVKYSVSTCGRWIRRRFGERPAMASAADLFRRGVRSGGFEFIVGVHADGERHAARGARRPHNSGGHITHLMWRAT